MHRKECANGIAGPTNTWLRFSHCLRLRRPKTNGRWIQTWGFVNQIFFCKSLAGRVVCGWFTPRCSSIVIYFRGDKCRCGGWHFEHSTFSSVNINYFLLCPNIACSTTSVCSVRKRCIALWFASYTEESLNIVDDKMRTKPNSKSWKLSATQSGQRRLLLHPQQSTKCARLASSFEVMFVLNMRSWVVKCLRMSLRLLSLSLYLLLLLFFSLATCSILQFYFIAIFFLFYHFRSLFSPLAGYSSLCLAFLFPIRFFFFFTSYFFALLPVNVLFFHFSFRSERTREHHHSKTENGATEKDAEYLRTTVTRLWVFSVDFCRSSAVIFLMLCLVLFYARKKWLKEMEERKIKWHGTRFSLISCRRCVRARARISVCFVRRDADDWICFALLLLWFCGFVVCCFALLLSSLDPSGLHSKCSL